MPIHFSAFYEKDLFEHARVGGLDIKNRELREGLRNSASAPTISGFYYNLTFRLRVNPSWTDSFRRWRVRGLILLGYRDIGGGSDGPECRLVVV